MGEKKRQKAMMNGDLAIFDKITDVFLESITINNPAQASYFNNLYIFSKKGK